MNGRPDSSVRVLGIGNELRRDDAVGLVAARRLHEEYAGKVDIRLLPGDCGSLLTGWVGAAAVIVIDAMASGGRPGTVHRLDVRERRLSTEVFRGSTHGLGLADAVELGRRIDGLPPRLILYGIEGENFEPGQGLSTAVAQAVETLMPKLREELHRAMNA